MPSPALQQYLSHLNSSHSASSTICLDETGRARGRYFNSTLTSAFQAIRSADDQCVVAYEAYARSYSSVDQGLNIWRLLDHAANDAESVELDRLCRILHAVNFYRQPDSAQRDLYLSVHTRLLAAIEGNHGMAFRRILDLLGLPHQQIVLQLPLIAPSQRWVLTHVADNYRRNGFRIGVNAASLDQARELLERVQPDSIKIDITHANNADAQQQLLEKAQRVNCKVIFKRIDNDARFNALQVSNTDQYPYYLQGFLFDLPRANLADTLDLSATSLVNSALIAA
ncbi:EAL domain-containing protein [Undibacterium sp. Xuan67W]|uniref:EAL domain-containing protein n=1 Tax=Undibacterium sp. Xuan67W TaxID=3413057 RepID=UPI003BEF88F4